MRTTMNRYSKWKFLAVGAVFSAAWLAACGVADPEGGDPHLGPAVDPAAEGDVTAETRAAYRALGVGLDRYPEAVSLARSFAAEYESLAGAELVAAVPLHGPVDAAP